jgi:PadR family transcriptional regulator, regulatory protein AphA
MSIKYAILGYLSWRPFSGYDLKKMIADSAEMYWSGNNNQIYKTLVQLHEEELVTQQVQYQESLPAKKIYSITEKGLLELKAWVLSVPELPELRNSFLIQLAWADLLTDDEINLLLEKYEEEVQMQLLIQQEKVRRGSLSPSRTQREAHLWNMISENTISFYENELNWIKKLRKGLKGEPNTPREVS